ncbi:alcohol dehydrogenase catalytic domain-containing protein [Leucobacter allii]|uniref:alcohol dehydrogenase n=1 Tax=Leucobacter allii TaxID=2932247 RepID=A0ABY4FKP6_9MICO|nr:alcohol dehydrogenase catalytic domain-containing protein [Leucobacter allii]UOQ56835.1 alcohol dehydrogenase catalytic domain-containing protein [Leucobacter allii]
MSGRGAGPTATAMIFDGPGRPLRETTVDVPALGPGELLVAVELATVCGSDVHTALGHRAEPVPLGLGHEAVGRIVAVGAADGSAPRVADAAPLAPGDRVVWSIAAHCGACARCRRGMPQKCLTLHKYGHARFVADWPLSGGFATHVQLLAGTPVVRVGEALPAAVLAPAGCGTATAYAALAAAERGLRGGAGALADGEVLVTGAGLIGLTASAMAAERGARVTVSDPDPERRALASRFGAARTLDPRRDAVPPAVFDAVIEVSGAPAAVAAGLDAVAVGGAVVWVGSVFPADAVPVDAERIVRGLATIAGVHNYAPAELAGAVAFLEAHGARYPFAELVGEIHPLRGSDAALARAAQQREVRVGIAPALAADGAA